ncbi:type IV toxin-antitoxin system AbiEi family antitoxin domain-containing protein [Tsukamurella sp. NPDC003166]|uniref:type IV toxin-antitoxin system AbiEi family antitoxin domain-containing protein n=1 Tax=Tsukamurella sp. NPDC003166 TaxID=3154444 RepID=UPI0033A19F48
MGEHGVVTRTELEAQGWTPRAIRLAVDAERLTLLRRGRYALPGADPDVMRAVSAGGGVSCMSALARHRVWVPESARGLHVRLSERARRRAHKGLIVCGESIDAPPAAVDDAATSVLAVADCVHGDELVAVFDSVLHRGVLQPGELTGLLRGRPRRVERALRGVDGSAESGTETHVRLHLRRKRLAPRTQVFIPGVGHVDLLVGRSLVIECDSEEHHAGEAVETDRERDLVLQTLGFCVLRVSYQQVFRQFPRVAAAIARTILGRRPPAAPRLCAVTTRVVRTNVAPSGGRFS